MEMRTLGTSDLQVSVVGLGCNNFGSRLDLAATRAVIHRALDAGITFFDTADIYGNRGGSETQLGEILGFERQRVVLASKFGLPMGDDGSQQGASRDYVRRALEGSLRRLRTDYLDLYQIHRPDPETPIEETLDALAELIREGMVRFIGVSNFSADGITEAQAAERLGVPGFISSQDEYSLLVRELETTLLPTLREHKLGLLPYFPLANGLLTGKYRAGEARPEGTRLSKAGGNADKYLNDANLKVVEKLRAFAEARERTLLELAFSWLLSKPEVASVIAGATKPEQVAQNAQAASWRLSDDELAEVDEIAAS